MLHNHVCGLYFSEGYKRRYLPQVELKSHTTINPVCFTTKLTQTFDNPNENVLAQVRYTFPLYDGVAVNSYTISYGDKTIHGVVEQKDQAKKTYQAAIDRGETAGLLESLPAGVFGVTLGNVPAKTPVVVDITYCGELKHDAAIDGLRYMLPTSIAPRYGSYPGEVLNSNNTSTTGISITVDVNMASSAIRKVQSPSHPIAVSMGALSATEERSTVSFHPSQASATLTQGSTELADDFILQLLIDDISKPEAILETHPELPNQRALMATLVPKFALESGHPEIVFIADQSGSMSGAKNTALVKALKVFLKSLPFGVRFNICAFGNDFKFLFPKSQAYNEDNLNTALAFVESFRAAYGGTEILKPITATFEQHLADLPLEVMLLTDGEVWAESAVFDFINEQIREKQVDARVFALGIGSDVSHTLVEGVARAGNGFAQFVTQDEETDEKVMRMLKGALYAHTWDYELKVHYDDRDEDSMSDEDDFEIVEKVKDCLRIVGGPAESNVADEDGGKSKKPMSFFDTSADLDKPTVDTAGRYAHLPTIDSPKLLQAPSTIAPLFPFGRTTLYLLFGPETPQKKVASVTLRAKSAEGPLELNIPVSAASASDTATIHQLAARKATQDLEEGRGWLHSASIDGAPVKAIESRFDELVERECVRLGERFQVAGKWTSFVAVEANGQKEEETEERPERPRTRGGRTKQMARMSTGGMAPRKQLASFAARRYDDPVPEPASSFGGAAPFGGQASCFGASDVPTSMTGGGLFGGASKQSQRNTEPQASGGLFGDARQQPQNADLPQAGGLFGNAPQQGRTMASTQASGGLFGINSRHAQRDAVSTGGLFGSAAQQSKKQSSLTSLFRSAPAPPMARAAATGSGAKAATRPPVRARRPYNPTSPAEDTRVLAYYEEMSSGLPDGPDATSPEPVDSTRSASLIDHSDEDDFSTVQAAALAAPLVKPDDAALQQYGMEMQDAACMPLPDEEDPDVAADPVPAKKKAKTSTRSTTSAEDVKAMTALIDLQTFSGAWGWSAQLLSLLRTTAPSVKAALGELDETVAATALAVAFLEKRVSGKKDVWEMVVDKARAYLSQALGDGDKVVKVVGKAGDLLG